jgi:hypothetical protein
LVLALGFVAACSSARASRPLDVVDIDGGSRTDDGGVVSNDARQSGDGGETPGRVYAHTADTLYLFEPVARTVTLIGKFSCLLPAESVIDIAVDQAGAMYATTPGRFLTIDTKTAECTEIAKAPSGEEYPNALSFVPAGTVDQANEALVGYSNETTFTTTYRRIDLASGEMTVLGNLNPPDAGVTYQSSGDIVAIIQGGKKAYLTVKEPFADGTDSLAEVDPKTGVIKAIIGDTRQKTIYGLGYWAGKAYGFAADGRVIQIDVKTGTSTVTTTLEAEGVAVPWYGAGVTTQAPIGPF